ncbi:MAG: isocitrate lyase/phosphoenolpyruvate mutase family protein [Candidatus Omnitrophica bacterium]|nr:isocitrate lyase/phosphoenolpyruvate mutase family protein [Candidatus Omnitrophota bacterium]
MFCHAQKTRPAILFKTIVMFANLTFAFSSLVPPAAYSSSVANTPFNLPEPGALIAQSAYFTPTLIEGVKLDTGNPLRFEFVVNKGDANLQGDEFKQETTNLIKYFLAALTVPEEQMWVNLSPYEKDRIIPEGFGKTRMGSDLLGQDYILKQLSASLVYPENSSGESFWNRVYAKLNKDFKGAELSSDTFSRIWIVPDKSVVYEDTASAFIVDSHLKVMMEEDYVALEKSLQNKQSALAGSARADLRKINEVTSRAIKEVLIPEIEKEVNNGSNFAKLRQIYNSMILAVWYKENFKKSLLGKVYLDKNKSKGIETGDKEANQRIYDQYLEAFEKGIYNYIKEDYDSSTGSVVPRKYFSGGTALAATSRVKRSITPSDVAAGRISSADKAMLNDKIQDNPKRVIVVSDLLENATDKTLSRAAIITSQDNAMLSYRKDSRLAGGNVREAYSDVLNDRVIGILEKLAPLTEKLESLRLKRETSFIERQEKGIKLNFLSETNPDGSDAYISGTNIKVKDARSGNFEGASVPEDLQRQWIQLTGPAAKSPQDKTGLSDEESRLADLRNVVHALLSGADGMMFDGEDALGQLDTMSLDNIRALVTAYKKDPTFWQVAEKMVQEDYIKKGKKPADWNWRELLEKNFTTRIYRVRGVHLDDRHIKFTKSNSEKVSVSATIADMTAYLVNAGPVLMEQGSTPTLYLPKLQTAEEAAFMAEVIDGVEDNMGWTRGTVKVFVLIEQLEETFQLMEIRAALGKHFVGFNTGRWDYIADVVKQNMWDNKWIPPNFKEMVMTYPFMWNYEGRVVRAVNTPDKNGNSVLWIGGMEPQIPVVKGTISAADKEAAIENAMQIAEKSKLRELRRGASGTWVAHPGMVERLRKVYETNLFQVTGKVNQLALTVNMEGEQIDQLNYGQSAADALTELKAGARDIAELRFLVSVGIQYVNAYLTGRAAAALKGADLFPDPLRLFIMEDMATGEGRTKLSRKWGKAGAEITVVTEDDQKQLGLKDGDKFSLDLIRRVVAQEYDKLQAAPDDIVFASSKTTELPIARIVVEKFVTSDIDLPWLIDLANAALGETDLAKATAKIDEYIRVYKESGGLIRLTQNPLFADAAMLSSAVKKEVEGIRDWMNSSRFSRIAKNRNWTAQDVYETSREYGAGRFSNDMADKLYRMMLLKRQEGSYVPTGGVMDGPMASMMAEAGITALYLSGWQTSHHRGRPDLARYPFDAVPKVVAEIYEYLRMKNDNQAMVFNKLSDRIDEILSRMFANLSTLKGAKSTQGLKELKEDYTRQLLNAVMAGKDAITGHEFINIFRFDERKEEKFFSIFTPIIDEAFRGRKTLEAQKRQALKDELFEGLRLRLTDYLLPIFADGDTGHAAVEKMIDEFVKAGAAAIHLEDQRHGSKKCGHMEGKVLTSVREHYSVLMEARKAADLLRSNIMIVGRTDADAAKLLATNEDERDQYFILGTSNKRIWSLRRVINLARRETSQGKRVFTPKTDEQLLEELRADFPDIASAIEYVWKIRGETEGKALDYMALLVDPRTKKEVASVQEIWDEREKIELGESTLTLGTELSFAAATNTITVGEILDREPKNHAQEVAAMQELTKAWAKNAGLKTYAKAVEDAINADSEIVKGKTKAQRIDWWRKITDPLTNPLGLEEAKEEAARLGVEIYWDEDKARTYEGFYQIDAKLGEINAAMRARAYAKIADSVWMEQKGPDIVQAKKFSERVNADIDANGVLFAVNLSPSFNWFVPDHWKAYLNTEQIANIKKAMASDGFDWRFEDTWGEHKKDVKDMIDAINSFSVDAGKAGFVFQFVTIFQNHVGMLAQWQAAEWLRLYGGGGFANYVQKLELMLDAPFLNHQRYANVGYEATAIDLVTRGASFTGATGKGDTLTDQLKGRSEHGGKTAIGLITDSQTVKRFITTVLGNKLPTMLADPKFLLKFRLSTQTADNFRATLAQLLDTGKAIQDGVFRAGILNIVHRAKGFAPQSLKALERLEAAVYRYNAESVVTVERVKKVFRNVQPEDIPAVLTDIAKAVNDKKDELAVNEVEGLIPNKKGKDKAALSSSGGKKAVKEERVGGINLNPAFLNLQIKRDKAGLALPLPEQDIKNMQIDGFIPVIINILPANNLPLLLGMKQNGGNFDLSSLK